MVLIHEVGKFDDCPHEMLVFLRLLVSAVKPMLRNAVQMVHFLVELEQLLELFDFLPCNDYAFGKKPHHAESREVISGNLTKKGAQDLKAVFI